MNETTKILLRGGALLIGGLVLVFVGKNIIADIKERKLKKRDEEQTEDEQGMSNQQAKEERVEAESYNPSSDLKLFESYVHGANFRTYEQEVSTLFNKLTDAKLCKLDKAHRDKHTDSMYQWLSDELGGSRFYASSMRRLSNAGCG